ncbi:MAG: tRNA-specific 2-thiouridylase [Parcubacteria group bacterium Greene0416_79]|nr:MAG: tRNA-specific 2-thiouridylase [Parcubacteria group bacterium Greene0416_79]
MESQDSERTKVFVGLSGGVDSSVSAALLKEAGYDVTGVFIKVWHEGADKRGLERGLTLRTESNSCHAKEDRLDAMRVCAKLDIPFRELNLEKEYKKEVVDYMIREYRAGKTPNPDVMCNRFIKFGAFYKFAREQGADFIATGHYVRICTVKDKARPSDGSVGRGLKVKDFGLFAGSDPQKDQSYFLWQIRKEQLPHILFPVGGMLKSQVRKLAKRFGLITADKKDSQGLCFVGKVDMKEFLGRYLSAKSMAKNTITVSPKSQNGLLFGARREVEIGKCNWLVTPKRAKQYAARLRYRQPLLPCRALLPRQTATRPRSLRVRFEAPQNAVTPGQSLVLYDGTRLIGGGIIP